MKLAVACDHAGFRLKEEITACLRERGIEYHDFGVFSEEAADYPDLALAVAEAVRRGDFHSGVLCCGTGVGVAIAANKVPGIRAAQCHDTFTARSAREHNDANILTMGQRVIGPGLAGEVLSAWLGASYQGGRHACRLDKLKAIEEKYRKQAKTADI